MIKWWTYKSCFVFPQIQINTARNISQKYLINARLMINGKNRVMRSNLFWTTQRCIHFEPNLQKLSLLIWFSICLSWKVLFRYIYFRYNFCINIFAISVTIRPISYRNLESFGLSIRILFSPIQLNTCPNSWCLVTKILLVVSVYASFNTNLHVWVTSHGFLSPQGWVIVMLFLWEK